MSANVAKIHNIFQSFWKFVLHFICGYISFFLPMGKKNLIYSLKKALDLKSGITDYPFSLERINKIMNG